MYKYEHVRSRKPRNKTKKSVCKNVFEGIFRCVRFIYTMVMPFILLSPLPDSNSIFPVCPVKEKMEPNGTANGIP